MPDFQQQTTSSQSTQRSAANSRPAPSTKAKGPVLQNNRTNASAVAVQRQAVIQREVWKPETTTAPGGLSPQLHAGYTLAVGSPGGKPAQPAWVLARVKQEHPKNPAQILIDATATANSKWGNIGALAQSKIRGDVEDKKAEKEKAWKDREITKASVVLDKGYDLSVVDKAKGRWAEAKWNAAWGNTEGFLPAGQTYTEYYAEASKAPNTDDKFFGKNRLVKSAAGGTYGNMWWASADHYENFTRVT